MFVCVPYLIIEGNEMSIFTVTLKWEESRTLLPERLCHK